MAFSENARFIMEKFYYRKDKKGKLLEKSPTETFERVSSFVVSAEKDAAQKTELKKELIRLMEEQIFMFSSPTLFNAGSDFPLSSSCFVGGLEDSMQSIMKSATDTAMTFKSGAGMGLNFGILRPKGTPVGMGGTSSGPVTFMRLFDEVGETVKSGGVRRAAFMAMMDVHHPDIERFISSKDYVAALKLENPNCDIPDDMVEKIMAGIGETLSEAIGDSAVMGIVASDIRKRLFEPLSNMNISVAITDPFMEAVRSDSSFQLESNGVKGKKIIAKELFHKIALSAWRTADPGVWFIDRANAYDTVPSMGDNLSTNPCGEQSLHHYTSCNLGSINLNSFITKKGFDYDKFRKTVTVATRALDNIIDVAAFPTDDFQTNTRKIRPIGLGFTGLAEVMFILGLPYNSEQGYEFASSVARVMTQASIEASVELAKEKGSFEIFEENKERLIEVVKTYYDTDEEKNIIVGLIRKHGIRNSNWTTLAPTGTISLILDAATYSMEPQFALAYNKNLVDGGILTYADPAFEKAVNKNPDIIRKVAEAGGSCQQIEEIPESLRKVFVTAHDINYEDRIKMQSALQKYITNSISSTINLPNTITVDEIEQIYLKAWELQLKGITIYRDGTKQFQPMTTSKNNIKTEETSDKVKKWTRPKTLKAEIFKTKTGSGTLYTSVGLDENGSPIEIFINISKHGSDVSAFSEALGRVISIALQTGVPVEGLADTLAGIMGDSSAWDNGKLIKSIPDAVGRILKEYAEKLAAVSIQPSLFEKPKMEENISGRKEIKGATTCPNCGEKAYIRTEDCNSCLSCGYSKCG